MQVALVGQLGYMISKPGHHGIVVGRCSDGSDGSVSVLPSSVRFLLCILRAMDGKVAQDVPKALKEGLEECELLSIPHPPVQVGSCTCCSFLRYHLYPFDRGWRSCDSLHLVSMMSMSRILGTAARSSMDLRQHYR